MDDTLTQPSLFDLLGRYWNLDAAVTGLAVDHAQAAVAFALADGRAAVVPLADAEAPGQRIRIEFDTGRTTIRPRSRPVPPPVLVGAAGGGAPMLAASGPQGFVLATSDGRLHRLTARGQLVRLAEGGAGPVSALAARPGAEGFAAARGRRIALLDAQGIETARADAAEPVGLLRIAPAGGMLAAGHGQSISLYEISGAIRLLREVPLSAAPVSLCWNRAGAYLACGCADRSVALIEAATGRVKRIGDFADVPGAVAFSGPASALLASGAYRLAGWRLDAKGRTPLKSGRPGLVPVTCVAAHPDRDIAATGYASGLLILSHLGQPGEVLLREGGAGATGPIAALAWSADGRHLAMGSAGGAAAVITFPDQFFKGPV